MINIDVKALEHIQRQIEVPAPHKSPLQVSRQAKILGNIAGGLGFLVLVAVIFALSYYEESPEDERHFKVSKNSEKQDPNQYVFRSQMNRDGNQMIANYGRRSFTKSRSHAITPLMIWMKAQDDDEESSANNKLGEVNYQRSDQMVHKIAISKLPSRLQSRYS